MVITTALIEEAQNKGAHRSGRRWRGLALTKSKRVVYWNRLDQISTSMLLLSRWIRPSVQHIRLFTSSSGQQAQRNSRNVNEQPDRNNARMLRIVEKRIEERKRLQGKVHLLITLFAARKF